MFARPGETQQLTVIVHWSDGSREDVTCLARFRSNDESTASVAETGLVTAVRTGDTHIVAFYDSGVAPVPVLTPVSELAGPRYPASSRRPKSIGWSSTSCASWASCPRIFRPTPSSSAASVWT